MSRTAQSLRQLMASEAWPVGQRLPSERALAARLEVSRPALRESLRQLAAAGEITLRPGRSPLVASAVRVDPLVELVASHGGMQADLLRLRNTLEGEAAYLAARRASDEQRGELQGCYQRLAEAHADKSFDDEVQADAQFHLAIAGAAHNPVLLHSMQALVGLLHRNVLQNLEQLLDGAGMRERIHGQHGRVLGAILERDAEQARDHAQAHLQFVEEALLAANVTGK